MQVALRVIRSSSASLGLLVVEREGLLRPAASQHGSRILTTCSAGSKLSVRSAPSYATQVDATEVSTRSHHDDDLMAMGLSLGSASVCLEGVGCLSLEIGEGPPRCDYMLSYDTDTSLLSHDYLTAKGGARRHDERRPPERVWRGAPGATWNVFRGLVRPR